MKRFFHPIIVATAAIVGLGSILTWAANYNVTEGLGKTFGSVTVGGIDYAQQFICDLTTPSNCANVAASGAVLVSATAADNAIVGLGATSDAAATVGSTGSVSAKLRLMTTQLDNINTNVQSAIPAGSAIIGKVGIDQTTPGTTNAVALRQGNQIRSAVISGTAAISASAVAAQGSGVRFAMTDYSCTNSGSGVPVVFFLDGNAPGALPIWQSIIPAGGGTVKGFQTPVSTTANTALIISTTAASTTVYCSVAGYSGT